MGNPMSGQPSGCGNLPHASHRHRTGHAALTPSPLPHSYTQLAQPRRYGRFIPDESGLNLLFFRKLIPRHAARGCGWLPLWGFIPKITSAPCPRGPRHQGTWGHFGSKVGAVGTQGRGWGCCSSSRWGIYGASRCLLCFKTAAPRAGCFWQAALWAGAEHGSTHLPPASR